MTALWQVFRLILREQPVALWRGAALGFVVLAMGAALLGLSGWFITAAAAAGLAGTGAVFDVFRPSAMVRLLALSRAAARYGERVLTHDATLRALEVLRVRLLSGLIAAPYQRMIRIRGAQALNRLTADIDALDGVSLRLMLPVASGVLVQLVAFCALWALVGLAVALWIVLGYLLGAGVIFWQTLCHSSHLSRLGEAAAQAFRARLIDLIRARRDLAVHGQLVAQADLTMAADDRRWAARLAQDRTERLAGAALQMLATMIAGGTLWLGIVQVQAGGLAPAFAALGFFAALALAETIAPLRRAAADLGRMVEAARRVSHDLAAPATARDEAPAPGCAAPMRLDKVTLTRPTTSTRIISALTLAVAPGETVALTGPSGAGKSTVLLAVAGLCPVASGQITLGAAPLPDWSETALRAQVTLLGQRSALMAGTVSDALRLAAPASDDADLWRVLDAVRLSHVLRQRAGLDTRIGPRGDGLSGGEARRLTLARALLRRPSLLLLDEPTEGLDDTNARAVLAGIRQILPDAAILMAAHREVEIAAANRVIALN